jgi:hypothetical protein
MAAMSLDKASLLAIWTKEQAAHQPMMAQQKVNADD